MNDTRNPGFDLPLSLETIEKFDQVGVQIGKCVTVLEEQQEFRVG